MTDGATDGAQVQNVVAGGPAAAAGILEGDVVVRVGGRPIAGADELVVAVREHKPGEQVPGRAGARGPSADRDGDPRDEVTRAPA